MDHLQKHCLTLLDRDGVELYHFVGTLDAIKRQITTWIENAQDGDTYKIKMNVDSKDYPMSGELAPIP